MALLLPWGLIVTCLTYGVSFTKWPLKISLMYIMQFWRITAKTDIISSFANGPANTAMGGTRYVQWKTSHLPYGTYITAWLSCWWIQSAAQPPLANNYHHCSGVGSMRHISLISTSAVHLCKPCRLQPASWSSFSMLLLQHVELSSQSELL